MKYFCFLLAFFFYTSAAAQLMGFKLPDGKSELEVPFKFQNNFILVELVFNQAFPLKFIFDTGSENTILVKKAFADILDVEYDRQFRIIGSDLKTELIAYLARGVNLDLPNMLGRKLDILVLEEDYFRFEEYTGIKIHGILGMDLFKTFTFKIDIDNTISNLQTCFSCGRIRNHIFYNKIF
jgi:hypothetical protein